MLPKSRDIDFYFMFYFIIAPEGHNPITSKSVSRIGALNLIIIIIIINFHAVIIG